MLQAADSEKNDRALDNAWGLRAVTIMTISVWIQSKPRSKMAKGGDRTVRSRFPIGNPRESRISEAHSGRGSQNELVARCPGFGGRRRFRRKLVKKPG